jgi:hypothetical protein
MIHLINTIFLIVLAGESANRVFHDGTGSLLFLLHNLLKKLLNNILNFQHLLPRQTSCLATFCVLRQVNKQCQQLSAQQKILCPSLPSRWYFTH